MAAAATAACFPSNPTFSICSHSRRSKPSRLSGIYSLRSLVTPPSLSTRSSRCRSSKRKVYRVRATTLQENKEEVAVEETFQNKSLADTLADGTSTEPSQSTPGKLERWIIRLEQSVNTVLTESVIKILDAFYHDRHYARFYVLETIARVPYFAFMSVLHMYESFGWWRRADYMKVHFAESWNELHHLLIMEELGGNSMWFGHFLAQHIAIIYYIMTVFMYAISPRMAYHFSECMERHAYATYDKFIKAHGEELKRLPPASVAVKYYMRDDLYLFDSKSSKYSKSNNRELV